MRTTIDVDERLLAEAIQAAGISDHSKLVREGLRELIRRERHSYVDGHGWPVLNRPADGDTVITNDFVNRLREGEET